MKTVIEVGRDGLTPLRVHHQGGRYAWTHALDERKTCEACQRGTLPLDVRSGKKRSV